MWIAGAAINFAGIHQPNFYCPPSRGKGGFIELNLGTALIALKHPQLLWLGAAVSGAFILLHFVAAERAGVGCLV